MNRQRTLDTDALKRLQDGNTRFISGTRSVEPLLSHLRMKELAEKGQKPFAIVLTCSDSRSPVEMIFDQGLGDLFVVRVAGNVVAPSLLASIEFAAANFGCQLVLVLGHSKCGAVNATIGHTLQPSVPLPSPHLEELIARIRPAVEAVGSKSNFKSEGDHLHACAIANIRRSEALIFEQSRIIRDLFDAGKIQVTGGILDIATGKVTFLDGG